MKTLSKPLIFSLFLILSCGMEGIPGQDGQDGVNCYDDIGDSNGDGQTNSEDCIGRPGPQGPAGKDGKDGKDYTPPPAEPLDAFINYWYLPYGGYVELIKTDDGRIAVFGGSLLISPNAGDETDLTTHPRLPRGPFSVIDGKITGNYRARYKDRNNLKDANLNVVNERRKTSYVLEIKEEKLNITLEIWNHDSTGIEITRTIISE